MNEKARTDSADRGRRIGLRAILVGALLCAVLCYLSIYGNMFLEAADLSGDYCIAGAILLLALTALAANPLLKLLDRSVGKPGLFSFTALELAVIFVMLALASGIVTYGFVSNVVPIITGGNYFGTPTNRWVETVVDRLPSWAVVRDPMTVRCFYEGVPAGQDPPWRPWVTPLACWSIFALAYFAVSVSLMAILRKQWMETERLTFPIAQAPLELIQVEQQKLLPRIAKSRLTWIGAAFPIFVTSWNCLSVHTGQIGYIGFGKIQWGFLGLRLHFSFIVAGLSYLLNTSVSLSIWLFHILYTLQTGFFRHLGYTLGKGEPFFHMEPAIGHQATGATIVFVLASLWAARRHLGRVLRCAWRPKPEMEDAAGLMSYRASVIVFVLGTATMWVWLVLSGMQVWTAGLYLAAALGIIYFLARVVAQTGVAAARPVFIPQTVVTHAVGTGAFKPEGLATLAYGFAWSADVRSCVMASMANGLRVVADPSFKPAQTRNWRRMTLWAIVVAVLVSLFVSYVTLIGLCYAKGAVNYKHWFLYHLPQYAQKYGVRLIDEGIDVSARRWAFTGLGAAVMGALTWAHGLFPWWPIHPVGFVIGASSPVQWSWTGIFIAWLLKTLVLKYLGPRAYTKTRDVAIGMVIGQVLCAGFWILIAAIFDIQNLKVPIL